VPGEKNGCLGGDWPVDGSLLARRSRL